MTTTRKITAWHLQQQIWIRDAGFLILDAGFWRLDAGCWSQVLSIGNYVLPDVAVCNQYPESSIQNQNLFGCSPVKPIRNSCKNDIREPGSDQWRKVSFCSKYGGETIRYNEHSGNSNTQCEVHPTSSPCPATRYYGPDHCQ